MLHYISEGNMVLDTALQLLDRLRSSCFLRLRFTKHRKVWLIPIHLGDAFVQSDWLHTFIHWWRWRPCKVLRHFGSLYVNFYLDLSIIHASAWKQNFLCQWAHKPLSRVHLGVNMLLYSTATARGRCCLEAERHGRADERLVAMETWARVLDT